MKLRCERPFAAPAKLATSRATNGNLPVRRGAGRHWNDKGALRMNVGMRVRGGLFAALIMFAMPVAATLAACLCRRRLPPRPRPRFRSRATGASKSRPSAPISSRVPAGASDQAQIDDGLKALIETGLFQDVRDQPGGRPPGGDRGRKPGDRPHRLRGQQEGQGRAAFGGNPVQAARHAVAPDGAVRRPAHRRNLSPLRPL
jgi:outer membrane protein insertion porin family